MDDTAAIRDKIAKLMALGQDLRANEFEAEAALRQAEKLMRAHAIDAAEIQARTGAKPAYNWQRVLIPCNPQTPGASCIGWFGSLAVAVATFTDCAAAWKRHPHYGMCIELRGDVADTGFAAYLLKHLRDDTRRESGKFAGSRRERESFRVAMVNRIAERVRELKRQQRDALRETATNCGSALVVVNNKIAERNAEFGAPSYGATRRRHGSAYAYGAGRAAGDRVGFGRPVEHQGGRALGVQP